MTDQANAPLDEWGALQNRLDEDFPRSWRPGWKGTKENPRKGDQIDPLEIVGTLVREDRQSVEWQGQRRTVPVPIIALHPTGELVSVWLIHSTIREDWERQGVQEGDRVAIRYEGKKEPKGDGNPYHAYKLAVARQASGIATPASAAPTEHPYGDEAPY